MEEPNTCITRVHTNTLVGDTYVITTSYSWTTPEELATCQDRYYVSIEGRLYEYVTWEQLLERVGKTFTKYVKKHGLIR